MGILGKGLGVKNGLDNLLKLMGDEIHPEPRLPLYFGYTRPTTSVTSCGSGWWRSITGPGGAEFCGAVGGYHVARTEP